MTLNFPDVGTGTVSIVRGEIIVSISNSVEPVKAKTDTDRFLDGIKESLVIPKDKNWKFTITHKRDDNIEVRLFFRELA